MSTRILSTAKTGISVSISDCRLQCFCCRSHSGGWKSVLGIFCFRNYFIFSLTLTFSSTLFVPLEAKEKSKKKVNAWITFDDFGNCVEYRNEKKIRNGDAHALLKLDVDDRSEAVFQLHLFNSTDSLKLKLSILDYLYLIVIFDFCVLIG